MRQARWSAPPSAPSTALALATAKSAYLKKREDREVEANGEDQQGAASRRQCRARSTRIAIR